MEWWLQVIAHHVFLIQDVNRYLLGIYLLLVGACCIGHLFICMTPAWHVPGPIPQWHQWGCLTHQGEATHGQSGSSAILWRLDARRLQVKLLSKVIIRMGVSKNNGIPKSSILIRCSIINHPFWGTTIVGNPWMNKLVGGNSNILYFHPEPWGRCPFWRIFFRRVETTS